MDRPDGHPEHPFWASMTPSFERAPIRCRAIGYRIRQSPEIGLTSRACIRVNQLADDNLAFDVSVLSLRARKFGYRIAYERISLTMLKSVPRSKSTIMHRIRRRRAAAAAGVAAVGLVLATAPAATAAPASVVRHFHVPYGASYIDGDATFTDRSVILDGTLHAVGCGRYVKGQSRARDIILDEATSTPRCDGNWSFHVPVPANVAGGADEIVIYLKAPDGFESYSYYRNF
ncbi:hypothetical protein PV458_36525 [Streptomyces sp. MN03-5084-2B]|nr:hypothetical protein [Streptomyces sp. MN03-5084-2B]